MKIRIWIPISKVSCATLATLFALAPTLIEAQELVPLKKRASLGLPALSETNNQFQSGPVNTAQNSTDPYSRNIEASNSPSSPMLKPFSELPAPPGISQPLNSGQPVFQNPVPFQSPQTFQQPIQPSRSEQPRFQSPVFPQQSNPQFSQGVIPPPPTQPQKSVFPNWKKLPQINFGGLGAAFSGKSSNRANQMPPAHPTQVMDGRHHHPTQAMDNRQPSSTFVPPANINPQHNWNVTEPAIQTHQKMTQRQPLDPAGLLNLKLPSQEPISVGGRTVETILQRFPNGKVEIARQVTQDEAGNFVNHGVWKQFQSNGQLLSAGTYQLGKRHGDWFQWHFADRTPLLKTAPYNEFNGPFLSKGVFREGKLHGEWTIFDAKQNVVSSIAFREGERHGLATWFNQSAPENAQSSVSTPFRQATYNKGVIEGFYREWSREKKIVRQVKFNQGRPFLAETKLYYPAKKTKEIEQHFLGGALVQQTKDDWETLEIATYETQGEQVPHGSLTMWYPNGQLRMKGQFNEGQEQGDFMWWHANGQKQLAGRYEKGAEVAQWTWWHSNGMKSVQGNYDNQNTEGLWTWWDPTGAVKRRQDFSTDNLFQRNQLLADDDKDQLEDQDDTASEKLFDVRARDASEDEGIPPLRASNVSNKKD